MTSRKALQEDAGSDRPESPEAKRPRLLDTTNSMTHGSDPTAQQQGPSPSMKAVCDSAAAAAATRSSALLGRRGLVDRTQYVRLLEQALSALGFADVAKQLELASGIASQPPQVGRRSTCPGLEPACSSVAGRHHPYPLLISCDACNLAHLLAGEQAATRSACGRLGDCHPLPQPARHAWLAHAAGGC